MTKKKSSTSKKKQQPKRNRTKSNVTNQSEKINLYGRILTIVGIFLFAASIIYLIPSFKRPILLSIASFYYVEPDDWATNRVQTILDLNNSIAENPNNKETLLELLAYRVKWFDASERKRAKRKDKVRFYSEYDQFHFMSTTKYDKNDIDGHNYEMNFIGLYVYRNSPDKLIKVQSNFVEIIDQKLYWIRPLNNEDGKSLEWINTVYKYSHVATTIAVIALSLAFLLFSKFPREIIIKFLDQMIKRIWP